MKKSIFKAIILLLTVIFTFSAFSACKNNNTSNDSNDAKTVTDVKTHKVEGTLHDVNVNYNEPVGTLSANGRTEYTVVSASRYGVASKFVSKHLSAATGVNFPLEFAEECNITVNKRIIALNMLFFIFFTLPYVYFAAQRRRVARRVGCIHNKGILARIFASDCVCSVGKFDKLTLSVYYERPYRDFTFG